MWMFACTGPPSDPPAPSPDWADVAPLVERSCAGCHFDGAVAGLPLTRWEEVHAARGAVQYAVEQRVMPPWPAGPSDFPFANEARLTDDEVALLSGWIDAGAPLGDGPDELLVGPPVGALPQVDVTLNNPAAYHPDASRVDDYRCFELRPSGPTEAYLRGFEVLVDNPLVVHHVKLLAVYPLDGGATLDAQAALDPLPGFACNDTDEPAYGGPGLLIGGWLPGSGATVFPDGSGVPLAPGARFVLVVHYHPPGFEAGLDQTEVALWTAPAVDRYVDPVRLTDLDWRLPPDAGGMSIAAGDPSDVYTYTTRVADLPVGSFDLTEGVELTSAQFHMHLLGTSGRIDVTVGGEPHVLLDLPRWDFDWQLDYVLQDPIRLGPDDTITLTCTYDNSSGATDVGWGEGTADEMCSAIVNVLPPASAE